MTETRLFHVSRIPFSTGLTKEIAKPIKPERFAGMHEGRLGKLAGMNQFGVNLVTLDPGAVSSLRHEPATFLAVGSRRPGEEAVHYPDDDIGPIHK